MILVNRDKNVMMGWTAKGGCTVACKMFFEYLGKLDEALEFHEFIHQYRQRVYEPKNQVLTNYYSDDSMFKFKVVRNPYKRCVSSYVHYMSYNPNNSPIIRELVQMYGHQDVTFEEYVNYVKTVNLTKGNTEIHQEHQHDAMELKSFKWDYICKIEDIKNEIVIIHDKFGVELELNGKILSSGHHTNKIKDYNDIAFNKKSSEVITIHEDHSKTIPDYRFFFNEKIKKDVYNLYQHDIDLYDYDIEL